MSPAAPILASSVLAVFLATLSAKVPADIRPQVVRGEGGALAVAFGDARSTISRAMIHKSDSYFHGGVDVHCTLDMHRDAECAEHAEHAHGHDGEQPEPGNQASFLEDPWSWINVHVRAPEIEKHLEGEKAVELMPWLRASVAADPHNIDAWTTAWYIANEVIKDRVLATRVIAEGRAKNPESLELLLTEGRNLYQRGAGDVSAAEKVFEAVRSEALRRCGGDVSKLSESDAWIYSFADNYVKRIQKGK
jgi:hypothetical protein